MSRRQGSTFKDEMYSSFDDDAQRKSLLKHLKVTRDFREYFEEQFKVPEGKPYRLYNPDFTGVDFYVLVGTPDELKIGTGEKFGMVEVDFYTAWNPDWPSNYRVMHFLDRKMKYLTENPDLPYLHVTFNKPMRRMLTYTRAEVETARGPIIKRMRRDIKDHVWEIDLRKCKTFGEWPDTELMKIGHK